jgi:hypothetical protein
VDDSNILSRVTALVDEEHALRAKREAGEISETEEHERLRQLEESLDQCWDLLRQRRARREAGQDPREAEARPIGEVEGYLQ